MTYFGEKLFTALPGSTKNQLKSRWQHPELFRAVGCRTVEYVPAQTKLSPTGALDRTALAFESRMANARSVKTTVVGTGRCAICGHSHHTFDCKKHVR